MPVVIGRGLTPVKILYCLWLQKFVPCISPQPLVRILTTVARFIAQIECGNCTISNITIKHRHLGINIICTSQNPKSIPNIIRNNIDIFCLYKFANTKMVHLPAGRGGGPFPPAHRGWRLQCPCTAPGVCETLRPHPQR
jgi:hypothetical protein